MSGHAQATVDIAHSPLRQRTHLGKEIVVKVTWFLIAASSLLATTWPATGTTADDPASSVTLEDAAGDVWMWDLETDEKTFSVDRPEADVLHAVARHGRRAVRVKMRFGDLAKIGGEQSFMAQVKTPNHLYESLVTVSPDDRDGRMRLIDWTEGKLVRCSRDERTVDYDTDVVRLRVPRGCLGRPTWVRLKIRNETWTQEDYYADNAHTKVADSKFTRRLYRAPQLDPSTNPDD